MGGTDTIIPAVRWRNVIFLISTAQVVPELHLGSVASTPVANINAFAALDADDAVFSVTSIGDLPLLVFAAQIGPLLDLGSIVGVHVVGFDHFTAFT